MTGPVDVPERSAGPLLRAGSLLVGATFLWVTLNVVVAPKFGAARWSQPWTAVAAVVLLVVLVAAAVVSRRPVAWLEAHAWVRRPVVAAYLALMFGVQLRLGYSIRFDPGWDAGAMEFFTKGVADGSLSVQSVADAYSQYPNNLVLASLMTRYWQYWFGAGHTDTDLALMLVNAAVLTLSVLLTYLAARRLGRPLVAYVALAFCFVLVGVSPWIGVVYSDTVGMLPVALLAYLLAVLAGTKNLVPRTALWAAIGLVGVVGYEIKPTVVFVVLGAVLVGVLSSRLRSWTRRELRARVAATVALGLGALLAQQACVALIDRTGLTTIPERRGIALPLSHFLMMGASEKPGFFNKYYGAYRDEDYALTSSLTPGPVREQHGIDEYQRRVAAMGAVGYAKFLNNKATWTLGDGTFFMYGEGGMAADPTPFTHTAPVDRRIQSFLGLHGDHYWMVVNTWQTFWLVVLLLMAAPLLLLRDRDLGSLPATAMRAAIFGLVVFILLFEGRSRYFYLYIPFFVLLASLAVNAIAQRLRPDPADTPQLEHRRVHTVDDP